MRKDLAIVFSKRLNKNFSAGLFYLLQKIEA